MDPRIYSEFRKTAILNITQKSFSKINTVNSAYLHVVESKKKLSTVDLRILKKILTYSEGLTEEVSLKDIIFIAPRIGTISPWSSRATDIIKRCGINILRIERIKTVSFTTNDRSNLSS